MADMIAMLAGLGQTAPLSPEKLKAELDKIKKFSLKDAQDWVQLLKDVPETYSDQDLVKIIDALNARIAQLTGGAPSAEPFYQKPWFIGGMVALVAYLAYRNFYGSSSEPQAAFPSI